MKLFTLLIALFASSAAQADDADMRRCLAIAEPMLRLACYDALMMPATAPAASSVPTIPRQPQPVQDFGRPPPPAPTPVIDAIESHIPGIFEGWQPKTKIRLANGQVWQVTDNSSGSYRLVDAKVKVRRGTLGSYFLELVNQNRALRVKRVE